MSYPNTKTIFDKPGEGGTTRSGLSTQIIIYVNDAPVGAIQSFSETQSRQTKKIAEVGTDGLIEIVPSAPTNVTLQVQRIVFDGLSLPESFSRGYKNIHAQRIPFDIKVIDKFAGTEDAESVITTYHNCWFTNLQRSYTVQDYVISETASVDCEFVSSTRNEEPVAATQNNAGIRDMADTRQDDDVEQEADTGQRRGALDVANLINAAY